jgi:hypothetical protein
MLSHTQGQALPATCIYATIHCSKTAYMPSLQARLCCIYAMVHWRWILVYTSTEYIFDQYFGKHICCHVRKAKLYRPPAYMLPYSVLKQHICRERRANCVAYMLWYTGDGYPCTRGHCTILPSIPVSIYAVTYARASFTGHLHICYHTAF